MTFVRGPVVVVVLLGFLALAGWPRAVAAADPKAGRMAFAEGQKLFVADDYRGAMTWFKQEYLQTQDPVFLLNTAQCYHSLGETQKALLMLRLYLRSSPEGADPRSRAVATKAIQDLEKEAGAAASPPVASPAGAGPTFDTPPASMPVLEPAPEPAVAKRADSAPMAASGVVGLAALGGF